jgi:UDP-2-acetamido-3-amino-2,3-dideoxy-glucuronate N-acetyltransferase
MTDYFVHPSSIVDEGALVGQGTKIWHFCHIMPKAQIGEDCNIGQNVFVASDVLIGNNVKIQNNVSVYSGVILEDDVFLGPSMVFSNVINPRSHVNRRGEYQITRVKHGVTIGANATVICGITLGEYSFVGAGAVVTKNVPPYALVFGTPANIRGWVCQCGIKLPFIGEDQEESAACKECGLTYEKSGEEVRQFGEGN